MFITQCDLYHFEIYENLWPTLTPHSSTHPPPPPTHPLPPSPSTEKKWPCKVLKLKAEILLGFQIWWVQQLQEVLIESAFFTFPQMELKKELIVLRVLIMLLLQPKPWPQNVVVSLWLQENMTMLLMV